MTIGRPAIRASALATIISDPNKMRLESICGTVEALCGKGEVLNEDGPGGKSPIILRRETDFCARGNGKPALGVNAWQPDGRI